MDAHLSSGVGGLSFGQSLYPHAYIVYASSDSSTETLDFSVSSEPSLLMDTGFFLHIGWSTVAQWYSA